MSKMTLNTLLLSLVAVSTVSIPAVGSELMEGLYLGGSVNYSNLELDGDVNGLFFDDSSVGFGAYAGYMLTPNVGFELGYRDFGTVEEDYDSGNSADTDLAATTLSMKIDLPIEAGLGMFMGFGYGLYDGEFTFTSATNENDNVLADIDDDGFFLEVGLRYNILKQLGIGVSYQYHEFEVDDDGEFGDSVDSTISEISVDAIYQF